MILWIVAQYRLQNLFEKVKYCRNKLAMVLSLFIREIFFCEFCLWVDERYQLSLIIFNHVTAKKNVHFRPEILHFFLAGKWTFFLIASYFYSKHTLMGERRWEKCLECLSRKRETGASSSMRIAGSRTTSSAENAIAIVSRASAPSSFHVPSTTQRGGNRTNDSLLQLF